MTPTSGDGGPTQLPLSDVRVLDLSRALAGPYCAMMLGDMGADVIKVENPDGGDETRAWGPPYTGGESAYFLSANRNKRSLTINVRSQGGAELLRTLAGVTDVLVENFGAGTTKRYGIDADTLRALNPGLIYCTVSSFRPGSRHEDIPGYDLVVQAMSGLMSITGAEEGEPQKVGVAVVDVLAGLFACNAVLGALRTRDTTGVGATVGVPLLDAALASLVNVASTYLVTGDRPKRWGNAHASLAPYQTFATSDGSIAVGVGNDGQFARLCDVIGQPHLAGDDRFRTNPARVRNRAQLIPILATALTTRPTAEWIEELRRGRVPAAPVNHVDEMFDDPYVHETGLVTQVAHPTAGRVPLVSSPLLIDGNRPPIRRHPPLLGEHTEEVLHELVGLDAQAIAELRQQGAI